MPQSSVGVLEIVPGNYSVQDIGVRWDDKTPVHSSHIPFAPLIVENNEALWQTDITFIIYVTEHFLRNGMFSLLSFCILSPRFEVE